jgi:anhydro-N-acetylmuramic acid kinase
MSGTSLDGVDAVLVDFTTAEAPEAVSAMKVRGHVHCVFPEPLRAELLALNTPGDNELHRAALAGNALARLYAELVATLLKKHQRLATQIVAIGAHGQTVRHQPVIDGQPGYSLQVNNPALLAELSGISVVADFRSRDVAAGGQGAPLVPAFHRNLFGRSGEPVAVLNLGGMSNLTVLAADGQTKGFDCGPANVLMDYWCHKHTGKALDTDGTWAASGLVLQRLLNTLLEEPYFALPPPKSTGRDLFNPEWLHAALAQHGGTPRTEDVQTTLCELTALTCAQAVITHAPTVKKLLVCGGGAFNRHLMQRLAQHLPRLAVLPTDAIGLPAMQVEAAAFAWLAYCHVNGHPGNLSAVTGAAGPRILGARYPA